ncbi:sulfurtransferase TusA family protein [Pseudooceanicola algae]|uniref:Sulfur carrier protein TusA n=1 Tax=Pseudooceanicola algae TaxID=1537215 RepID=A0A418SEA4_9RHOB|nr:sulfurtransferase TusA family protein [Pseudooceanicola algae]QPM89683.1 Sulfur carrier protein TusA [Pseudooceanicola algae]
MEILEVDARGLRCPLPVLRARKRLNAIAPGTCLRVLTDDPMAQIDMPHFCNQSGHEMLSAEDCGGHHVFVIRKSA